MRSEEVASLDRGMPRREFLKSACLSAAAVVGVNIRAHAGPREHRGDGAVADRGSGAATLAVALASSSSAAGMHDALRHDLQRWARARFAGVGCRGYVLSLRIPDPDIDAFGENRGWAPAPHALIQYAFDSVASAKEALGRDLALLPRSVTQTIDAGRSSVFVADETVIFSTLSDKERWAPPSGGDPPVKMIVQNWKRPDLSFEEYSRHWRTVHARLLRDHGPQMGFRRYVQSHRVDGSNETGRPDGWGPSPDGGLTEVWWKSYADMKRNLASPAAHAASALFEADEKNFVFPPRMSAFLATEMREALTVAG